MRSVFCCKPGYGSGYAYGRPGVRLRALPSNKPSMQSIAGEDARSHDPGICRAGLEDDAPFALAIAASVLSTLVLPADSPSEEGNDNVSPLGGDDIRYAAMGIISFIPLFNWLVWVFAWLDTRKQRYLIYAIVYIAPYLRSGLSLSPEDSWLPIASVLACILHVQPHLQMCGHYLVPEYCLGVPFSEEQTIRARKVIVENLKIDKGDVLYSVPLTIFLRTPHYSAFCRHSVLSKLDISASSEGGEDLNVSKPLFKASQVKQMKERADNLRLRLQLAERPTPKPIGEKEETTTAEDISQAEMEQWDEKLAKSEESTEPVRDGDS